MRSFSALIAVCLALISPRALADQFDPDLDDLFAALARETEWAGEIVSQIETRWRQHDQEVVQLLIERVDVVMAAGDTDAAADLANHLVALSPHFAEGWWIKGRIALLADDHGTAEAAFETTIGLEPRHFYAHEALGRLKLLSGERAAALRHFRDALDLYPAQPALEDEVRTLARTLEAQAI